MKVVPLEYGRPRDIEPGLGQWYFTASYVRRVLVNVAIGLACLGFVYWTGGYFKLIAGFLVGGVAFIQCLVSLFIAIRMMERSSGPLLWRSVAAAGMLVGVFISAFASWSGITRADWCC